MDISPGKTRIGWIGTGVMGSKMCAHLLDAGYSATVTTRTRSKANELVESGARWADNPKAVAQASDLVFTIVGFPRDVREVLLGDQGALAGAKSGAILVDMTTSEPSLAIETANAAKAVGVSALDAPVSGGEIGAAEARLSIMVGGERSTFEKLLPCFEKMGTMVEYQGPAGSGQHTKLVNQTLIASNMVGVCEALLYAHRAGLNIDTVMRSVASGAAGSWSLSNLGPKIIANNFEPGFFVEHFVKDMGIALREAEQMGLKLPGLELAHGLYRSLEASGRGRRGTQALQLALAEQSGIDWIAARQQA